MAIGLVLLSRTLTLTRIKAMATLMKMRFFNGALHGI
jgi:hypothetical protein